MVSTRPHISKPFSPSTNPWVSVPRMWITITVTFMFHYFFSSPARSRHSSLFSLSFSFTLWSVGTAKSRIRQVFFFCCLLSLGLAVWPRLDDPFVSQNPKEYCASHFLGWILGFAYTICSYGQFKLLTQFPVAHLAHPLVSTLTLFCTNSQHLVSITL